MKNMMNMMKQAQDMQRKMQEAQAKIQALEVTGKAGDALVTVTMTGSYAVKAVQIKPEVVDSDDVETLEDMVTVALNDAISQIQQTSESEMRAVTGGMNIPGLS
jgi:DNA-binding YbaB/EbfC family protein